MGRKVWLVLGAVLLLGTGVLVWSFVTRPAFGFLAGPAASPTAAGDKRLFKPEEINVVFYTFKGEWKNVCAEADKELRSGGFTLDKRSSDTDGMPEYYSPSREAFNDRSSSGPSRSVILFKNVRYDARGILPVFMSGEPKDVGWITVGVAERGHRSFLDEAREWLGL